MDAEQRAEIRGAFARNGFLNEMIPVGQSTGVEREYGLQRWVVKGATKQLCTQMTS